MSHRPRMETEGYRFTRHSTTKKAMALRVGFCGELPGDCFRDSCTTWCGIMPCGPSKRRLSGSTPTPRRRPRWDEGPRAPSSPMASEARYERRSEERRVGEEGGGIW